MAKTATDSAAAAAEEKTAATATKTTAKATGQAASCPSGFYVYIGPNLKKYIQTGTVLRGTRAEALEKAAAAIEAYPVVKSLIVSGDALPEARLKVRTPGNALYASYQKLAKKGGK